MRIPESELIINGDGSAFHIHLRPEELADKAVPGARVYVPFARGNRRSEGVILAMSDHSEYRQLKHIRWLRNQIAHSTEYVECTQSDAHRPAHRHLRRHPA